MRHPVLRSRYVLPLGLLALFSLAALFPRHAESADLATPSSTLSLSNIDSVLLEGSELEAAQRWGEALAHYEGALRSHPGDSRLESRFTYAKIHYDLGRRYRDTSFRDSLLRLPDRDVLNLYSEVLLKIQSHYVNQPNWPRLVERGTISFEVALGDTAFRKAHLADVPDRSVRAFRQSLVRRGTAVSITDRHAAHAAVSRTARMARQELGIPTSAVVLEYLCAAAYSLDDYSTYLTASQLTDVYSQIDGNFVGLGIELKSDQGGLLIVNVITGGPASLAGMMPGDRIIAVDGVSTSEMHNDEAADLLQGADGSLVDLTVISPNETSRLLQLQRRRVEVPSVDRVKIVDTDQGIAYLRLSCFQKSTLRELDTALWKLHRQGMRSLIVDVRGNPGGLLTASVEVSDKFIERGTIVSTRGRNPNEDYHYTAQATGTWHVPLVVLVDGDSASASEIFAGAIHDNHRGTIVGTRSYGKGSVQGIFPLGFARSGIRLTTAKFFSPTGKPYSHRGVNPDIVVHQVAKPVGGASDQSLSSQADADPALSAAIQTSRRQLARR